MCSEIVLIPIISFKVDLQVHDQNINRAQTIPLEYGQGSLQICKQLSDDSVAPAHFAVHFPVQHGKPDHDPMHPYGADIRRSSSIVAVRLLETQIKSCDVSYNGSIAKNYI